MAGLDVGTITGDAVGGLVTTEGGLIRPEAQDDCGLQSIIVV